MRTRGPFVWCFVSSLFLSFFFTSCNSFEFLQTCQLKPLRPPKWLTFDTKVDFFTKSQFFWPPNLHPRAKTRLCCKISRRLLRILSPSAVRCTLPPRSTLNTLDGGIWDERSWDGEIRDPSPCALDLPMPSDALRASLQRRPPCSSPQPHPDCPALSGTTCPGCTPRPARRSVAHLRLAATPAPIHPIQRRRVRKDRGPGARRVSGRDVGRHTCACVLRARCGLCHVSPGRGLLRQAAG